MAIGWSAGRKRGETHLAKAALWAIDQDSTLNGMRYKSEVLSLADLFKWFSGGRGAQQVIDLKGVDTIDQADEKEEERIKKRIKVAKKDEEKSQVVPYSNPILGEIRYFEQWLELRDKARKDLFWLGRDILKRDLVPEVHQIVCDQFVKKNFDDVYFEGYSIRDVHKALDRQERYDDNGRPTKELMLLDPRGFFKTTLDGIDCVQWLLNVPDIRILILAGEFHLSIAFLSEIKGYFNLPKNADPTDFHFLFPEYILRGLAGESDQPLWCPARKHNQKEASVWTNAIFASLSGWHCDVRKGDDVVTDRNCPDSELRRKLKEKYDGTDNLVDEWGFSDHIGTRYWTDDWYGTRLDTRENDETAIKYFVRQCWTVKPEYTSVPLKELTKEMVVLTFPDKATFASLRRKLLLNETSFRNQQLNEPLEDDRSISISFKEEILRSHLITAAAAPKVGDVFVMWDTALTANKKSDFSCGVAARVSSAVVEKQTIYSLNVLEIVYGRFKQSDLAMQIIAFEKKWQPKQTIIEKLPGSELFQREVRDLSLRLGVPLNIYWLAPSLEANAKRNRIFGLETLLKEDRLWFVGGPWIEEAFAQLVKYTGERKNRGRKDDIPDALSYLHMFLPATIQNEVMKAIEKAQKEKAFKKAQYDWIYGPTKNSQPPAQGNPNRDPGVRGRFGIPGLRAE